MYGGIKVKTLKNKTVRALGALFVCAAFAFGMTACSNGSDTQVVYVPVAKYTVTISSGMTNGSVTADKTSAAKDETVTLTISPASGYKLDTLSVTAEGGASVAVSGTGNSRTFAMPAKSVTVTATFAALPPAASGAYTPAGTTTINGTQYDLVTFGLWPQTVKADGVTVNDSKTKTAGEFTYCKGSDGEWYAKLSDKYYKVEPIKWRVLTTGIATGYNGTGKKLLLAESVLIGKRYAEIFNNYQNSEIRKWLNGNANSDAASDYSGSGGFLKTAFTAEEQAIIQDTSVINNAHSTNPDANATQWNSGNNLYASSTPTTDKVFLLSEQEVTTSAYGFDVYNAYKGDGTHNESARIRQTTDYAKASGANQSSTAGMGGWWWLRSPLFDNGNIARNVNYNGNAYHNYYVNYDDGGVVPALCVSN